MRYKNDQKKIKYIITASILFNNFHDEICETCPIHFETYFEFISVSNPGNYLSYDLH